MLTLGFLLQARLITAALRARVRVLLLRPQLQDVDKGPRCRTELACTVIARDLVMAAIVRGMRRVGAQFSAGLGTGVLEPEPEQQVEDDVVRRSQTPLYPR